MFVLDYRGVILAFFTSRGPPELIYSTHVNIMDRREGGEISNAVSTSSTEYKIAWDCHGALAVGSNISLIVMCDVVTDMSGCYNNLLTSDLRKCFSCYSYHHPSSIFHK